MTCGYKHDGPDPLAKGGPIESDTAEPHVRTSGASVGLTHVDCDDETKSSCSYTTTSGKYYVWHRLN